MFFFLDIFKKWRSVITEDSHIIVILCSFLCSACIQHIACETLYVAVKFPDVWGKFMNFVSRHTSPKGIKNNWETSWLLVIGCLQKRSCQKQCFTMLTSKPCYQNLRFSLKPQKKKTPIAFLGGKIVFMLKNIVLFLRPIVQKLFDLDFLSCIEPQQARPNLVSCFSLATIARVTRLPSIFQCVDVVDINIVIYIHIDQ